VRVRQRKDYYEQLQKEVDKELKSLEDFKQSIYSGKFIEQAKGNIMFDPTTVNSKIIELKKERINYLNSLELVNSVQVVEGFTKFDRPVNGRKFLSAFVGGMAGCILAFMIMGIRALNVAVKKSSETYPA
jgi:hypothetical protein